MKLSLFSVVAGAATAGSTGASATAVAAPSFTAATATAANDAHESPEGRLVVESLAGELGGSGSYGWSEARVKRLYTSRVSQSRGS